MFKKAVYLWSTLLLTTTYSLFAQPKKKLDYFLSFPDAKTHQYHVRLVMSGFDKDSITLTMPRWMPGYYQFLDYGKDVSNFRVTQNGRSVPFHKVDFSNYQLRGTKGLLTIDYDINTTKQFVANSYVTDDHAYIIPANSFFYINNDIKQPVTLHVQKPVSWKEIATGLTSVQQQSTTFTAPDFDILYDCPLLLGNLERIPSFNVGGKKHQFLGYKIGSFERKQFSEDLSKIVKAASDIIGDIPYNDYKFIAIGPGGGGIEHLNNTTISFDGNALKTKASLQQMYAFLAHEYFHHYNVKRIRPVELGPFDYQNGSKTTQLWISEGLSVYYEYLIVKRAGLATEQELLNYFNGDLNAFENDAGKSYQSLIESSFQTWEEGPFGIVEGKADHSISYYQKGPLVGLLLDFEIRNSTANRKSLDDVMRYLYYAYYKERKRGFTDAEFREACERIAQKPLEDFFRYIYKADDLDYDKYLAYGGLKVDRTRTPTGKWNFKLTKLENPNAQQQLILKSWMQSDSKP